MKYVYAFLLLVFQAPASILAGPILSLSSAQSLSNIPVGQSITIDVSLSGLDTGSGQTLDSLAATVEVKPDSAKTLFDAPSITAGAIVPDPSGFLTAPNSGVADATYDVLFASSSTPISSNGVFFSFNVTAAKAGSGDFEFTSLSAFDSALGTIAINNGTPNGNLQFNTVPEPSSLVLLASSAFIIGVLGWLSRCGKVPAS